MKKFIFYVGMNDKDSKRQEHSKEYFLNTIYNTVGDCTISDAYGCYTHDDGTGTQENTLRVEMLFKNEADMQGYADRLKLDLNQESIGYEVVETNSRLL